MRVEVVYALPALQRVIELELANGATLSDAIAAAAPALALPDSELAAARVGIFGKLAPRHTVLLPGDRIEIYRALRVDPKQARRRRAVNKAGKSG